LTTQVQILSNTTINGGGYTLTAASNSRHFAVSGTFSLTLNHLILTGGITNSAGGSIINSGTLTINDSSFTNNNTIAVGTSASLGGGALFNNFNAIMTIDNTTFTGNVSPDRGGAIFNRATLTITNSTFTSNQANGTTTATDGGGAVYNYAGTTTITDSDFQNNTAVNAGGALYNVSTNASNALNVSDSTFTGNTATANSPTNHISGNWTDTVGNNSNTFN